MSRSRVSSVVLAFIAAAMFAAGAEAAITGGSSTVQASFGTPHDYVKFSVAWSPPAGESGWEMETFLTTEITLKDAGVVYQRPCVQLLSVKDNTRDAAGNLTAAIDWREIHSVQNAYYLLGKGSWEYMYKVRTEVRHNGVRTGELKNAYSPTRSSAYSNIVGEVEVMPASGGYDMVRWSVSADITPGSGKLRGVVQCNWVLYDQWGNAIPRNPALLQDVTVDAQPGDNRLSIDIAPRRAGPRFTALLFLGDPSVVRVEWYYTLDVTIGDGLHTRRMIPTPRQFVVR